MHGRIQVFWGLFHIGEGAENTIVEGWRDTFGTGVSNHRGGGMVGVCCTFEVVVVMAYHSLSPGKESHVSKHDIVVVDIKIMGLQSHLIKTLQGPYNVIQRFLPSFRLTLPNHVSPKEEHCEHAEETVDANSSEGFPVVSTRSKEPSTIMPPLGLKRSPLGKEVGLEHVKVHIIWAVSRVAGSLNPIRNA